MGLMHALRTTLWRTGIDLCRFEPTIHPLARRRHFLRAFDIDTVLDVGANVGQFAQELRRDFGYDRRIVSFEPLSSAFIHLRRNAQSDDRWDTLNYALGEIDGNVEIGVAANSYSSSLLDMLPAHEKAAPASRYASKETISIRRLDSIYAELCAGARNVYLKIDTQGYERHVLAGGEQSLAAIQTVQLELSIVPLYRGQTLFNEMCALMADNGYTLIGLEGGFSDPQTAQLLQVDGIFHRFA